MIFSLYTETSALIIYIFPTSREHRNIVQICTTSHLKCGILILPGLRSATSKDLLTSKVYPVTYYWWGRWWSRSLQSFDKDYQEPSSFSSCYMGAVKVPWVSLCFSWKETSLQFDTSVCFKHNMWVQWKHTHVFSWNKVISEYAFFSSLWRFDLLSWQNTSFIIYYVAKHLAVCDNRSQFATVDDPDDDTCWSVIRL